MKRVWKNPAGLFLEEASELVCGALCFEENTDFGRPVTGTTSKGAALFRKKAAAEARKRIKKVEAGKKFQFIALMIYRPSRRYQKSEKLEKRLAK